MSFNGSGTFVVNSAGQPVVANTVISATVFNALTADLATGLSTCITKDGQTTVTANIPFGNNKITALGAGTAASDAANLGQVQSTAAKLVTVTGTDTITGTMSPALTAYAAGQLFYFIANAANTGAVTINIDGLGAKSITRDGSTALTGGDINSGEVVVVVYDGTRFQMINAANSFGNTTINGTLTVTGNTALQANVSITSTLSVGGTFAVTGAATLGSTLAVTGKSDLPTVSTASINAAVALITTGTVTNLTASGASIASANIGNLQFTAASIASINAGVAVVTNLTATSASIASMNAGVALLTTATVTSLTATGASVASANVGTAVVTGLTVTGASIASVNAGTATLSGNLTLNGGTANGVLYLNGSKVATSGSALTFDGTRLTVKGGNANSLWVDNGGQQYTELDLANNGTVKASIWWDNTNTNLFFNSTGSTTYSSAAASYHAWNISSEQMRLTSTGLGIGTTSPTYKLDVDRGASNGVAARFGRSGGQFAHIYADTNSVYLSSDSSGNTSWEFNETNDYLAAWTGGTERLRLVSGNLGLGVTPSAWESNYRVFDIGTNGTVYNYTNGTMAVGNNLYVTSGVFKYKISSYAPTLYAQFTGQHAWYTAPSGTAGNTITFTQAATLDANGTWLLGTTTAPAGATSANKYSVVKGSTEGVLVFGKANTGGGAITGNAGAGILFYTYTGTDGSETYSERARITAGGYFKASNNGTYLSSTGDYHELTASGAAGDYVVNVTTPTSTAANCYGIRVYYNGAAPNGTGNVFLACQDNAATRAAIRSNGGLANYQANNVDLSDARTKNSITPAASMWDKVAALEIVTYKYNDQTHDDVNLGVIAQQVESVEPVWVDADGFGETPEGEEPLKTVYTKDITFAAIKALQEAMARIEQLEAKVAVLEAR